MRIVVSDSSCLIDLRKASLLEAFVRLPYELLIPNTLFEDELLKFTAAQKRTLSRGMSVVDLPGESVRRAIEATREQPRLTAHDGFAYALARLHEGCILLSGDGALRIFAAAQAIEVRGVLWVIDELHRHGVAEAEELLAALTMFQEDTSVRLPAREIAAAIRRIQGSR